MQIDSLAVTFILSLVLPLIVGIVTKVSAHTAVKQVALIVTTAVATLINANLTDAGYAILSWDTVSLWGISLVATIASYLGFYKPLDANDRLLPEFGLGASQGFPDH